MAAPAGVEPTAEGHVWVCCSCPYRTGEIMEARAHVEERERNAPFSHAMYEAAGGDRSKAKNVKRWIYTVPTTGELRLGDYAAYRKQSPLYGKEKRAQASA